VKRYKEEKSTKRRKKALIKKKEIARKQALHTKFFLINK